MIYFHMFDKVIGVKLVADDTDRYTVILIVILLQLRQICIG